MFDSSNDIDGIAPWSDPFVKSVTIGNVPVHDGDTVDVPLNHSYAMRFELSKPVSHASLSTLFDFEIFVDNLSSGQSYLLTPSVLEQNGKLVWVGSGNDVIEYRANQRLSELHTGGFYDMIGSPGDKLRVRIIFLLARSDDGKQISILDDSFYIVWTS